MQLQSGDRRFSPDRDLDKAGRYLRGLAQLPLSEEKMGSAHPTLPAERRRRRPAPLLLRNQILPLPPYRFATHSRHSPTLTSTLAAFKMGSTDRSR